MAAEAAAPMAPSIPTLAAVLNLLGSRPFCLPHSSDLLMRLPVELGKLYPITLPFPSRIGWTPFVGLGVPSGFAVWRRSPFLCPPLPRLSIGAFVGSDGLFLLDELEFEEFDVVSV